MQTDDSSKTVHTPPPPNAKRPKGLYFPMLCPHPPPFPGGKGANKTGNFRHLEEFIPQITPESPIKEKDLTEKELTIINTQTNAGHRRSSSAASRPAGTRRRSSRTSFQSDDELTTNQRLQWDEANLYLTEQERTSTMKITEPKTPYARHYEPSEDEDEEMIDGDPIPGLSLGEPEEAVPESDTTPRTTTSA
ncbi:hypothetical protein ONZ43_g284 [Nemania bipapillata]|uniref:Uncharacterized protein n=1 Tax=Nemania bipapillata TaxID=110536 RepID=A0ACC2J8W4_9PEZI|nr:hypothetical protein ONZ43_g284 [Nemania bipapillata]